MPRARRRVSPTVESLLVAQLGAAEQRYASLLEMYQSLAKFVVVNGPVAGSPVPPIPPVTLVMPERPRSVVQAAIREEAQGNPALAAHLAKRAAQLRAEGKTPEEVAVALSTWTSTEEDDLLRDVK